MRSTSAWVPRCSSWTAIWRKLAEVRVLMPLTWTMSLAVKRARTSTTAARSGSAAGSASWLASRLALACADGHQNPCPVRFWSELEPNWVTTPYEVQAPAAQPPELASVPLPLAV